MALFRQARGCCAALALACGMAPAIAQESQPAAPPPRGLGAGDVQAVFETLLYRGCQRQIRSVLDMFEREIRALKSDQVVENRVCGCTVKVAGDGPKMKKVFEMPVEKLRDMNSDPEVMEYIKAKTAIAMLQCTGFVYDQMLDPKAR